MIDLSLYSSARPLGLSSRLCRSSSFFLALIARPPFSSVFLLLAPPYVSHLLHFVLCRFCFYRFALSCRWFLIGLRLLCPRFGLGEESALATAYPSFRCLEKKALLPLLLLRSTALFSSFRLGVCSVIFASVACTPSSSVLPPLVLFLTPPCVSCLLCFLSAGFVFIVLIRLDDGFTTADLRSCRVLCRSTSSSFFWALFVLLSVLSSLLQIVVVVSFAFGWFMTSVLTSIWVGDSRSVACCVALLAVVLLFSTSATTEAYDLLDPNGNITIKWDIMH